MAVMKVETYIKTSMAVMKVETYIKTSMAASLILPNSCLLQFSTCSYKLFYDDHSQQTGK